MNIYVVTGQTATGKTAYALELAAKHNGELVNCDSRQVYKKLDIITGKDIIDNSKFIIPASLAKRGEHNSEFDRLNIGYYKIPLTTNYQLLTTKLWLYDVVDPKQLFSSFDFVQCAQYVIDDILKRGKSPVIVGGNGLYLHHLIHGLPENKVEPDWNLRNKLESNTVEDLQKILKGFNVQAFNKLNQSDRSNPRRLIRRIEIENRGNHECFDLSIDRNMWEGIKFIYAGFAFKTTEIVTINIEERVGKRLQQGAIEEVQQLMNQGYSESDPGLHTIGYQQIIAFLKGKMTKLQAIDSWIVKERQYAKRQLTYLKKYFPEITWKYI